MKNVKIIGILFNLLLLYRQCNAEIFYWKIDTAENVIFLTFDDGPGEYTKEVLKVLDRYNVKATFFVLGEMVRRYPTQLKEIFNKGHDIGTHTYSHINFYSLQKKNIEECKKILNEELANTDKEIKSVLNNEYKINLLRMPYGYYRKWIDDIVKNYGYKVVNWTFGCDWENISEEEMFKRYSNSLQKGGIYLFHDGGKDRKKTVIVLEKFIKAALANGYKFGILKDYLIAQNKNF